MPRKHKENSQALFETNYRSLRKLFPGVKDLGCWQCTFMVGKNRLDVHIQEQTPYTTMLKIEISVNGQMFLPKSSFVIRMYHDALVAEVVNFQGHRHLRPFYVYPNSNLYYADEKRQTNRLGNRSVFARSKGSKFVPSAIKSPSKISPFYLSKINCEDVHRFFTCNVKYFRRLDDYLGKAFVEYNGVRF